MLRIVTSFAVILTLNARSVVAQTATEARKWEIGVLAGGAWTTDVGEGTTAIPAPGPVVQGTERSLVPSRAVSSWFFGDGAYQVNQTIGVSRSALHIAPLDAVLQRPLIDRRSSAALGFRIGRTITRRLGVELDFAYRPSRIEMPAIAGAAVEETRASFVTGLSGVLTSPVREAPTVAAAGTIEESPLRQAVSSGRLIVHLRTSGRTIPYIGVGAGVVSWLGAPPRIKLAGDYQFRLAPAALPVAGFTIHETDTVTVRTVLENTVAWVVGGGIKRHVTDRWGIRVDVRDAIGRNTVKTVVDAEPASIPGAPNVGGVAFFFSQSGTLVFSTSPGAGTLSGPPFSGYPTFVGAGSLHHVDATAGVFWRF